MLSATGDRRTSGADGKHFSPERLGVLGDVAIMLLTSEQDQQWQPGFLSSKVVYDLLTTGQVGGYLALPNVAGQLEVDEDVRHMRADDPARQR